LDFLKNMSIANAKYWIFVYKNNHCINMIPAHNEIERQQIEQKYLNSDILYKIIIHEIIDKGSKNG